MITVFVTLCVILVGGLVFGGGFLAGSNYVLSQQRRRALAKENEKQARLSWMTENNRDRTRPPSSPLDY